MPAFSNECRFSKTVFIRVKIRTPPPKMLLWYFRTKEYPLIDGVLPGFPNFFSWIAKSSMSELMSRSQSSRNFGRMLSAFYWYIFSLLQEAAGWGCIGIEFVDPGSWQTLDAVIWFCWTLIHMSLFHWSSLFEASETALHFWWQPLLHAWHLTGTMLEHKVTEHLAHFSLEILVSARDMP